METSLSELCPAVAAVCDEHCVYVRVCVCVFVCMCGVRDGKVKYKCFEITTSALKSTRFYYCIAHRINIHYWYSYQVSS